MATEDRTPIHPEQERYKSQLRKTIVACLERKQVSGIAYWGGVFLSGEKRSEAEKGLRDPTWRDHLAARLSRYIPRRPPDEEALIRAMKQEELVRAGSGPAFIDLTQNLRPYLSDTLGHQHAYLYFSDSPNSGDIQIHKHAGYVPPVVESWQLRAGSNLDIPRWDNEARVFKGITEHKGTGMVLYVPNVDAAFPRLADLSVLPDAILAHPEALSDPSTKLQFTTRGKLNTFAGFGAGEQLRVLDSAKFDVPIVPGKIGSTIESVARFMKP